MTRLVSRVVLIGAVVGLGCPIAAHAGLILTINGNTIADNGAGDSNAQLGFITNSTPIPGFDAQISVARSNSPGNASNGLLQISALAVKSFLASTATLTISASDTNFTLPAGPALVLGSSIGGTFSPEVALGSSVSFTSSADATNAQPAAGVSTPTQSAARLTPGVSQSFPSDAAVPFVRGAGAYSLANTTVITLAPSAGDVNFSGTTSTFVPEPASVAALAAAGLLMVRRRTSR